MGIYYISYYIFLFNYNYLHLVIPCDPGDDSEVGVYSDLASSGGGVLPCQTVFEVWNTT